jgi:plasmid stability protein
MAEQGTPTGINHEAVVRAIQHGGSVEFEGRQARVVGLSDHQKISEQNVARLELDLGNEYLVLFGFFRGGEFIETGRESPF